jgi:hypothetical protein
MKITTKQKLQLARTLIAVWTLYYLWSIDAII